MNKQDWKSAKIAIKESSVQGKGMFANEDMKEDEKLVVWGGTFCPNF